MKTKRFLCFSLIFITISLLSQVFAAEYEKDFYTTVQEIIQEDLDVIVLKNKTTYGEAVLGNKEITDIIDGVSSGDTPGVKMSLTYQKGTNETERWRVAITNHDISVLDKDERIIQELKNIQSKESLYDKVFEINEFVRIAKYDKEYSEFSPEHRDSETALGCLNGKAICQGYANLASYLYDKTGIENVKVRGNDKETGGRHVWNVIKDKDEKLYVVDSTWNSCNNKYLMMSLDDYNQYMFTEIDVQKLFDLKYSEVLKEEVDVAAIPMMASTSKLSNEELLTLYRYSV